HQTDTLPLSRVAAGGGRARRRRSTISRSKTHSPDARKQDSGSSTNSCSAIRRELARRSRRKAICAAVSECFAMRASSSGVRSLLVFSGSQVAAELRSTFPADGGRNHVISVLLIA